jgi:hypothetical protein
MFLIFASSIRNAWKGPILMLFFQVWVMRKCNFTQQIVLWEAASGCSYAQEDDSTPLQHIYCLVSKEVNTVQ